MQTHKKTLYVITKGKFGGAQRYVFDLACARKAAGGNVSVALGGSGILGEKLRAQNIPIHEITSLERDINPLLDIRAFFELYTLFRREKPNIVHLNSSKVGVIGTVAGRLAHVPKIFFTAHGWAFNDPRLLKVVRVAAYPLHLLTMFLSTKTIAVSESAYNDVAWLPFARNKLVVIKNGIAPSVFFSRSEARAIVFKKIGLKDKDAVLIGALAELHPVKGLTFLIQVMTSVVRTHPHTVVIIFGEGELREELQKYIKKQNLEQHVFLPGFDEDAVKMLTAFDIFVQPSLSESLSYAILEAGTAELAVVASSVGGIPEIIEHNVSGFLVPPCDTHALQHALIELLENPKMRTRCGNELKRRVERDFSLTNMLKKTFALYSRA
jgi:glycosyltransferase involved in cell wall biosynthesis